MLIEKGLTTPEYYPMTLNAIVAGCNQKNNRDPLTHYEEEQVEATLQSLQKKAWCCRSGPRPGRPCGGRKSSPGSTSWQAASSW
ncbi:MAG: DUF480 domain-containing protein [Planctomycetota bacterium]